MLSVSNPPLNSTPRPICNILFMSQALRVLKRVSKANTSIIIYHFKKPENSKLLTCDFS